MQGSEKQAKSRNDEDSINFRPSPNFKHMKKYLKSKFEEDMANPSISQSDTSLFGLKEQEKVNVFGHNKQEKVNVFGLKEQKKVNVFGLTEQEKVNVFGLKEQEKINIFGLKEQEKVNNNTSATAPVVNPPLPPNPPPPDSPPIVNFKKEIEDDEYTCEGTSENQTAFQQQSDEMIRDKIKTDYSETSEKPERTMCRNFARGTCKKGAACIFAHEMILSQLPGVYTFCRNFQNTVCTFPKCKFVHATVFEKEYFFRTGYLPPHTLAHLKEPTVLQPPPPPPPPEEPAPEIPAVYSHGPVGPAAVQQSIVPMEVLDYAGVPAVESNEPHIFGAEPSPTTFSNNEFVAHTDHESCDPMSKKCKYCESNEFRLQVAKNMYEKMLQRNQEFEKTYSMMVKRNTRLNKVIDAMFKNPNRMATTSRLPLGGERNLMTNNVATLFAMMMRNNVEDAKPPDAS